MQPEKREVLTWLHEWAENNILVMLKDVEKSWQPSDFLPDSSSEGYEDQVKELRKRTKEIPDEFFVALVGHMITEEALPTYQTFISTLDGVRDDTAVNPTPWAAWVRGWTAEENRHGDLLNRYLYLSGRVDMKHIEKTIQYLIGSGMVIFIYVLICKSAIINLFGCMLFEFLTLSFCIFNLIKGYTHGEQPISWNYLRVISRKGNLHISWKHS